jgi:hypothetical protein
MNTSITQNLEKCQIIAFKYLRDQNGEPRTIKEIWQHVNKQLKGINISRAQIHELLNYMAKTSALRKTESNKDGNRLTLYSVNRSFTTFHR